MGKATTASLAWQGTREALALSLPEHRLMVGLSAGIFDGTTLSMEWMHDTDYSTTDVAAAAGTDKSANTGTVKLAVEF